MKIIRNEKGFTFLEMCMVVVIIGVLMLIAVPDYQKAVAKAQTKSCESNRKLIESQLENYYLDNNTYPPTDDPSTEGVNETLQGLKSNQYIKEEPKCPSNGKYTITIDAASHTVGVTCSAHPNLQ